MESDRAAGMLWCGMGGEGKVEAGDIFGLHAI